MSEKKPGDRNTDFEDQKLKSGVRERSQVGRALGSRLHRTNKTCTKGKKG